MLSTNSVGPLPAVSDEVRLDLTVQFLDMFHQRGQMFPGLSDEEPMGFRHLKAGQRTGHGFFLLPQAATGEAGDFSRVGLALEHHRFQHHRARNPEHIAEHAAQLDVALLQQFLHPILFLCRIADQFPPPPREQP